MGTGIVKSTEGTNKGAILFMWAAFFAFLVLILMS